MPQPVHVPLDLPVMLMHGFGLMGGVTRLGAMHDAAMILRSHGVRAFAPNVIPYAPPTLRAEAWRRALDEVIRTTGAEAVHIVAHSMGGLDARYLVSKLGGHEVVRSLTTISSPHRGSSIAPFLLNSASPLKRGLDVLARKLTEWLMGTDEAAFLQALEAMHPDYMRTEFNPSVPDHPDVRHASIVGYAGPGTPARIYPTMLPLARLVYHYEGINDGFVAIDSAEWGEAVEYVAADHGQQIGLHATSGRFDVRAFYVALARGLLHHESEEPHD